MIAGAAYLGPSATVGKVAGGAVIVEIANGTYQWFDLIQPGSENKTWDYKNSVSAAAMGMLSPGRTIIANVGIAIGGSIFTDGLNTGAVSGAVAGAAAGGFFGKYAPAGVDKIAGGNNLPDFIYDVIGSGGSEVIGGFVKDGLISGEKNGNEGN